MNLSINITGRDGRISDAATCWYYAPTHHDIEHVIDFISLARVTDPLVLHPNAILTSGNGQQGLMTTRTKHGCTRLTGEKVRTLNEATTKK